MIHAKMIISKIFPFAVQNTSITFNRYKQINFILVAKLCKTSQFLLLLNSFELIEYLIQCLGHVMLRNFMHTQTLREYFHDWRGDML